MYHFQLCPYSNMSTSQPLNLSKPLNPTHYYGLFISV